MNLCGGTKGVCRHISTLTLKSVLKLRKSEEKVNRILGVKLSHPYIGVCENKCLREMRCVIRRRLKGMCTVLDVRWRALVE